MIGPLSAPSSPVAHAWDQAFVERTVMPIQPPRFACGHGTECDAAVAEGRIELTEGASFSANETAAVGIDLGTAVVEAVGAGEGSRLTGEIPRLTMDLR